MPKSIKLPKVFLDSGNPEDTKKAKGILGFIDGQTTNPSLVAKHPDVAKFLEKGKKLTEQELLKFYRQIIREIGSQISGPVSVEVYADWNTKAETMLKQAEEMYTWGKNCYVKFPVIPEGLKAAHEFVKKGGRVNMTLVFDQQQSAAVYLAVNSHPNKKPQGAFISPFAGRWDDRGYLGLDLVRNIIRQYKEYDAKLHIKKSSLLVLSASIRNLEHLYGSIFLGADILTVPLKIIYEWVEAERWMPDTRYRIKTNGLKALLYEHVPLKKDFLDYAVGKGKSFLLDEGLAKFVKDWKNLIG